MESKIMKARPEISHGQVNAMLRRWFVEDNGAMCAFEDNRKVVEWLSAQLDESSGGRTVVLENIVSLRRDAVVHEATHILKVRKTSCMSLQIIVLLHFFIIAFT